MAIIFSQKHGDEKYEIRSAGNANRLYTNGVFHSQWNPNRPLGGAVWDLLSLPVLYLPRIPHQTLRILLLGVGGGAVLRQMQLLVPNAQLTGVELDAVHLDLAREYFAVDRRCAQLHCADAVQWLRSYRGPAFDCVIDDLFTHRSGEPERAISMDARWAKSLKRVTKKDGMIVANFTSARELRDSALIQQPYSRVYQWSQPGYENAIGAFIAGKGDARSWREALQQHPQLSASQRRIALAAQRKKIA